MQTDLSSVVSNLCVFAGCMGLFLDANKGAYNSILTLIFLANISYGIFLDALPKIAHPKTEGKLPT